MFAEDQFIAALNQTLTSVQERCDTSFFTPSLNLISVMILWQYSNSTLNKLLLSALLFRPLIHLIFIDTATAI